MEVDLDDTGREGGGAAGVAKLSNGDQRGVAEGRKDVGNAGGGGELR